MTTSPSDHPRVFAIGGPTASGKTALAVALARAGLPVDIVNFDASQLYRGLDAATAKPTPQERAAAPFHLVDVLDPREPATAGTWADQALPLLADLQARGRWPILVGGTGLYLRALRRGLAPIPPVDPRIRQAVLADLAERGALALHAELAAADPAYAASTPAANRQRVCRALEVYRATGIAFSQWHDQHRRQPDRVAAFTAVLTPQKPWLHQRISLRAEAMVAPLLAEVAQLLAAGVPVDAPAMQALGYRDAAKIVQGHMQASELPARLLADHLAYAKRQMTWFAAEPAELRLDPAAPDPAEQLRDAVIAWFGR